MDADIHIRRLLAWDEWANRELIGALGELEAPPERPLRLLAHVVAVQRLWLTRLQGRDAAVEVWPELSLTHCDLQVKDLRHAWRTYLDDLPPGGAHEPVVYRNSKGETWENTPLDVLTHVVAHGAHHRGQILSALREAGVAPPYLDFIHAARRGWIG